MFNLKNRMAVCVALAMVGGIITCTAQPAVSGDLDKNTTPRHASAAATRSAPAATLLAQADEAAPAAAPAQNGKKPNIIFIMGDDIGWFNIGAYHQGIMAGRTPHLDRLAAQGMRFTDYYAEASCTAGRANFITGQLPIRTGLTTVGQAGASIGIPAQAVTIATALKSMGYATGQFGKNHLGDLNKFLPTVHGFDEFFGYLYHLDAMEDPAHPNYPQDLRDKVGPRNMLHCWATDTDDPTVEPRWGKDRQAEDRRRRRTVSQADGNGGRRDSRFRSEVLRQGAQGRQAFLPVSESNPHARCHATFGEISNRCAIRRTAGPSRKPDGPIG